MSFCSNCGNPLNQDNKFCPNCGNLIPPKSTPPTPAEPIYYEPSTPVYVATATPVVSTKAKVLGFVGMGLSIGGLVMAALGLLYTFIFMGFGEGLSLIYALIFGFFSFPLSIVGGILSNNSMNMGNYSTPCSVGSKLCIVGIILSAVMLFFGFLSLAM